MPSIAQQDYLRPSGKTLNDCHLLAALAHNLLQETLFDTIVGQIPSDGGGFFARVLTVSPTYSGGKMYGASVYVLDDSTGELTEIAVRYTQTQYEGLAAIQDAAGDYSNFPALSKFRGYLAEDNLVGASVTVNGKKVIPTIVDGKIAAVAISDVEGDGLNISWEDAQKLIGLPIAS